ncbi:MAG TPA: 3-oxoacyl-[acyl-carrier-protein] reductase [Chloroflexi bacterium]|nr:3-oxoacyl-[acyl-carrier-protein] reductase [Chloroflexota bacterium]
MDMSRLDERIAIVTGGSRGIGRAVALELARRGAAVMVNYRSNARAAAEVVAAIEAEGGTARAMQADVSDYAQAESLIKETIAAFGGLHILVNNAGTTRDMVIMMMSEDDWDSVIRTNLKSAFNCSKAAVKHMMRKRYGRIINMSSVAGIAGNAGQTNYSASKAGLIGFTKALAREVAARNITVNAVAPGFIPTDLTESIPENLKEASLEAIPLKRWGTPEEVAYATAFLASDEAAYITGHVLSVDGGMVMG